ncbi:arginine biosynthesis bifunctional protein ArgJ, chloroplastic-like [Fagus crenata]
MYAPHYVSSIKLPPSLCAPKPKSQREFKIRAVSMSGNDASNYIPKAPIFLPEGPWKQIPGGVTAAEGFKAAGMYGGLRAKGEKPDLALVTCDVDATSAGAFTTNVVAAALVLYSKKALDVSKTARAVLINAGQANAATGDAGYQDVIECATSLAELLQMKPEEVLIESTGVIGQRIKKEALLNSLPKLVALMSSSTEGADSAAVAITTTDLVSKSIAIESQVGGRTVRVGGMAKGSGMIHPNMATMLGVITTDALVTSDVWRKMLQIAVNRSFNQLTGPLLVRGLKLYGSKPGIGFKIFGVLSISNFQVSVTGADSEAEAAKIARSVASSSLAAVYGRDPNWGRIAAAAGYAGISFHQNKLRVLLGYILLMDAGEPQPFDR